MNTRLAKAVQAEFGKRLHEELPRFAEVSDEETAAQCQLYAWHIAGSLRAYLMLQVHRSDDSFTVEVAWTRHRRWPATFLRTPSSLYETPEGGDMRFRLSRLWGATDHWWQVGSDAAVANAVRDALRRVVEHALPFFEKIATSLGVAV